MTFKRQPNQRRIPASPERIQAIIRACQGCGLEPTSLTHHPDGRTTIAFLNAEEVEVKPKHKPKGWNI